MCCFWGHLLEANCRSLLRFLDLGMEETSEPTLFRAYFKKSFVLLLIYVDDHIIVVGPLSSCAALYGKLAGRYQIKETGRLPPGQVGSLGFLGRVICRTEHGGGLKLCLKPSYFDNIEEGPGRKSQSYQPTSQFGAVWETRPRDFEKFLDVWPGFPSLCLSCLSIYRGWQVFSRVPLWVVNMVLGAQTLGFLWREARG